MLEKYRPSMTEDVLHSWAEDAQKKIDNLSLFVEGVISATVPIIAETPEGRDHIARMTKLLNT